MEHIKQTPERDQAESVGWTDLSKEESFEQADSDRLPSVDSTVTDNEECLVTNSNRLQKSFEDLSASLAELSAAMEETIR